MNTKQKRFFGGALVLSLLFSVACILSSGAFASGFCLGDFQCDSRENCVNNRCMPGVNNPNSRNCYWDQDCSSTEYCQSNRCVELNNHPGNHNQPGGIYLGALDRGEFGNGGNFLNVGPGAGRFESIALVSNRGVFRIEQMMITFGNGSRQQVRAMNIRPHQEQYVQLVNVPGTPRGRYIRNIQIMGGQGDFNGPASQLQVYGQLAR